MANLPVKLHHIGAKIARSIQHLKALDEQIVEFLSTEPYVIETKFELQQRTHFYRAKASRDVPLPIRVLTGEVLYQLRSVLDHVVWQLALLTTPTPLDSTEFPIFKDEPPYTKSRAKKIGSLPSDAQLIIDKLQPYRNKPPEDDLLWVLHRLTNDDKHRLPHLVGAAPRGIAFGDRRGRDMDITMRIGPFDDETIIGTVVFLNPAETDMEVKSGFAFDLAFPADSAGKGHLVRGELAKLGKRVEEVVRMFERFF
jgi:hypothetical protein